MQRQVLQQGAKAAVYAVATDNAEAEVPCTYLAQHELESVNIIIIIRSDLMYHWNLGLPLVWLWLWV